MEDYRYIPRQVRHLDWRGSQKWTQNSLGASGTDSGLSFDPIRIASAIWKELPRRYGFYEGMYRKSSGVMSRVPKTPGPVLAGLRKFWIDLVQKAFQETGNPLLLAAKMQYEARTQSLIGASGVGAQNALVFWDATNALARTLSSKGWMAANIESPLSRAVWAMKESAGDFVRNVVDAASWTTTVIKIAVYGALAISGLALYQRLAGERR